MTDIVVLETSTQNWENFKESLHIGPSTLRKYHAVSTL